MKSKIHEENIETIEEYVSLVKNYGSCIFRGHANGETWKLEPKIVRAFSGRNFLNSDKQSTWQIIERDIFYNFKRLAVTYLKTQPSTFIDWMVIGQHYGLPTRLLDWTTNPLIALFFALQELYDTKSVIWVRTTFGWFNTISLDEDEFFKCQDTFYFYPQAIDNRIISQSGCFTVHPLPEKRLPFKPLDEAFLEQANINDLFKIVIPNKTEIKVKLMKDLHRLGVTHNFIYSDLQGLCANIQWELLNDVDIM